MELSTGTQRRATDGGRNDPCRPAGKAENGGENQSQAERTAAKKAAKAQKLLDKAGKLTEEIKEEKEKNV